MTYQIQAVNWRGGMAYQQDAVLIAPKVYQHKGLISRCYDAKQFCIAVADGVSASPYSALASRTLLQLTSAMYADGGTVDFAKLQHKLNQALTDDQYTGASSTLVCAYSVGDDIVLKHLGDSRAYRYDGVSWHCLTEDHSFINELKADGVAIHDEYASCYDALVGYFVVDRMADMSVVQMASCQTLRLKSGESLLLCSDGFSEVLDGQLLPMDGEISPKQWLSDSIHQIKQIGRIKPNQQLDNISAILVRCV
ncbi:protein phosphatase 2C domain-containing protein [Moraxella sp. FZFQ2102]|uniref:PP2C family protein-serine/threonine phosphatase n=1 Tax=Moraxella sp. FZFQ2102 TaxID=2953752 RepID=UPI00209BF55C|nr:protein phosphatase 2C domain-containing protein [Moraxella sp. FZFQ2102]USZ14748.1 protein phosphatase 2C domain-containing protein [Moraxella sp. FZFQ2102]